MNSIQLNNLNSARGLFFYLKRADTLLGVLELCGGDFPWHEDKFEPTAAFNEVRPLLEYITPLIRPLAKVVCTN